MAGLTETDRTHLLKLARSVITAKLEQGTPVERPVPVPPALEEKRGCFVTLHKNGMLRGCIGTIEPVTSLIAGVEENAVNAAFRDPRFPPLSREELADIDLEISVLTVPEPLDYSDSEDLKAKLKVGSHGVILSKGWHQSTFLPQVWTQLPDKEAFLAHLCQKAGLSFSCWKDPEVVIKVYEAEYFGET